MLLRYLLPVLLLSSALLPARGQTSATPPGPDAPPTEALPPSVPPTPEPAAASLPATVTADAGGFTLQSADGAFALRLRGDVMTDGRFFVDDPDGLGAGTFYVRRIRPVLQGTLYGRFDFKLMPNFAQGRAELQDAYLDARLADAFAVRAGKFKVPVGLELLQSPTDLALVELAFPTALVPNRDVGVQAHGEVLGRRLAYQLGVFNGTLDGASADADTDDGVEVAGRLFARPFRGSGGALDGLGLGVAGTWGEQGGAAAAPLLPTYRTSGRRTFYRYLGGDDPAFADGAHARIAPQAYLYAGPVGLMGEYVAVRQEVRRGDEAAELTHGAWQVTGHVVLTGERAGYGALRPARPFDPSSGAWGAVELAARVHGLTADADAFPLFANPAASAQRATAWAAGVNWYLNGAVRVSLNVERTWFDTADGADVEALPTETVVLSRFQIAF